MEFNVRVSKTHVTLTTVPKGYGKPGFLKRLPVVLAKRPKELVEKFINDGCVFEGWHHTITINPHRNGKFVVGEVTFGDRAKEPFESKVVTKTKILINRDNGIGIRLCFLPDELVGKRVSLFID